MPDPADMTRAEDAIVEAMARARWDQAVGRGEFDRLGMGERHLRAEYERVVLAAARRVEIEVACETCGGTARQGRPPSRDRGRYAYDEWAATAPPCPDCQDGTRTVNALGLLAGEEADRA